MDVNQNLKLTPIFNVSISEIMYHEPSTGRTLAKVFNHDNGLYYILKRYDKDKNNRSEIKHEMVSLNKQLHEPGLFPKCHMYNEDDKYVYLLLDWMEGKTLSKVYSMPPKDHYEIILRLKLLVQLARSVEKIHAVKILHRDLKPDNILIVNQKNPSAGVRIIDFGLSSIKATRDEGTINYRSPEQEFRHAPVDKRSDIFSLGQIIYWALTGSTFNAVPDTIAKTWIMPEFNILSGGIQLQSNELFSKLLAFNPHARLQSMREVEAGINKLIKSVQS